MKNTYLSNPAPGESLLSGNLVMETGCTLVSRFGRDVVARKRAASKRRRDIQLNRAEPEQSSEKLSLVDSGH